MVRVDDIVRYMDNGKLRTATVICVFHTSRTMVVLKPVGTNAKGEPLGVHPFPADQLLRSEVA